MKQIKTKKHKSTYIGILAESPVIYFPPKRTQGFTSKADVRYRRTNYTGYKRVSVMTANQGELHPKPKTTKELLDLLTQDGIIGMWENTLDSARDLREKTWKRNEASRYRCSD